MARKTPPERFNEKTQPMSNGCTAWTAKKLPNGYGQFYFEGTMVYAHRWAYMRERGPIPAGMDIDHICHNRACVNVDHLRIATRKQNLENVGTLRTDNTSGYRGVSWSKQSNKWWAYINHNGKRMHVGLFNDVNDANNAVIEARNKYFTHNDLDRAS